MIECEIVSEETCKLEFPVLMNFKYNGDETIIIATSINNDDMYVGFCIYCEYNPRNVGITTTWSNEFKVYNKSITLKNKLT